MNNAVSDQSDGFIYAIDVEKVFAPFHRLPERVQASIERYIVNVINDSFIIPADEDYMMARLLAQKGLHRGFFWAASQALEKYFKAYLLMHDQSVKEFSRGHPLKSLFEAAAARDPDIGTMSLKLHDSMNIDASSVGHVTIFTVTDYIDDLSVHGAPANRYNASGVTFNTGHLFALDAFVYQVRKRIGVCRIEDSFKRISKDLIDAFFDNNFHFAHTSMIHSTVPSPQFAIKQSGSATWLDYLRANSSDQTNSIALGWLEQKMKL